MNRDAIDLGKLKIPYLFRIYFVPTLFGMLSICALTVTDGIFVGQGVGSDALAAVNICVPPTMLMVGIGLMLGVGASVVSSVHLAENKIKTARLNVTQALVFGSVIVAVFLLCTLINPARTARLLGASETLLPYALDYMPLLFIECMFQIWCAIGLFIVRLDGAPKYAMWCNVVPGIMNIVLDYIFIFPLGMGLWGAAVATAVSCFCGFLMVMFYLIGFASKLRLIKIKLSKTSLALFLRNIGYQCKIGLSAFIGEATMGILMFTGNLVFMHYIGDSGVGAFSIVCYYCPFVFMLGNAIAQSAQPTISYNYGLHQSKRVTETERIAIFTAICIGILITVMFQFIPSHLAGLFLDESADAYKLAVKGMPYFSVAFVFFIFNLTAIGYFQSVEDVLPATVFSLLRGVVFLIPAFVTMPLIAGTTGIWLALFVSELMTSIAIICYFMYKRHSCGNPERLHITSRN